MTDMSITSQSQTQYLSFTLCGEEYAVDILRVREIIEYDALTRVPAMPPSVRGVINLRGRVVPVLDLAARFGLPESQITRRSCIVMVELDADGESLVMGLMADAVSQVLDLSDGKIEPPPSFGTAINACFIRGMAETGKKFVIILDVDRVLDVAETFADVVPAA